MTSFPSPDFEKAEMLKNMLVSCATGGDRTSLEYGRLRMEFIQNARLADKLPSFIKTCRNLNEFWGFIQPQFAHYRERRDFIWAEFEPLLSYLESGEKSPADDSITGLLKGVDSEHVQQAWRKALDRRATDPDGAITAARTLLETVCKHILDERKVGYGDHPDLPDLYGYVAKELRLAPNQQIDAIMKQIAGGCFSVINGLAGLRNRLGDSHGKGKTAVSVQPREAHLAVNLAGALAVYLVESWENNSPGVG
jgi:hypothetical protein